MADEGAGRVSATGDLGPLWEPSPERVRSSQLSAFARFAGERAGLPLRAENYAELHAWSVAEPQAFWTAVWDFCGIIGERGEVVLRDSDRMPGARWFPEARLNFAENLLHPGGGEELALIYCDERGVRRTVSREALRREVARLAGAMAAAGVQAGDRVAGWLPNLPEAVIAMLASAWIGAVWSSCSPDFGTDGVVDRLGQIDPVLLFAADGACYAGVWHDHLGRTAEIRQRLRSLRAVVVVDNTAPQEGAEADAPSLASRLPGVGLTDAVSWQRFVAEAPAAPPPFAELPFDHPLYLLYSSGTTGVPKCIVHGAGGTLLQHRKEHQLHVDLRPGDRFFYYTTTGWMMWNWLVSGLASGATLVLYDGSPLTPHPTALFDLAEREEVAVFGVSAKYLDAVQGAGLRPRESHRLPALKTVLSTGSPLAPEGFRYVYESIHPDVCLSSISGGTDIVSCFACGNPAGSVWPGECQALGLGMAVAVFDPAGRPLLDIAGELVCTRPFPSLPLGFWNDPEQRRFRATYFERYPGVWWHGDYAALTERGGLVVSGRSDATLNPGGVRIGTAEIYRQVEQLDAVAESLAIGQRRGGDERIVLFVMLRDGLHLDDALRDAIRRQLRHGASPRHVPAVIVQVADLPRTRNGKLAELAVRDVVHGRSIENREALANPEALDLFRDLPALCG